MASKQSFYPYTTKERTFGNGDSTVGTEEHLEHYIMHLPIKSRHRIVESGYQPRFSEFPSIAHSETKRKSDPVREIAKLMAVGKETAQKIFSEIENDIDQICNEEKVKFLTPDEKAEFVSGMLQAISSLGKRLSKHLK